MEVKEEETGSKSYEQGPRGRLDLLQREDSNENELGAGS